MEEKGIKNKDLANVYGTEQMVKDVLERKRSLSINMIRAYGKVLQIPSRALIQSCYYQAAS